MNYEDPTVMQTLWHLYRKKHKKTIEEIIFGPPWPYLNREQHVKREMWWDLEEDMEILKEFGIKDWPTQKVILDISGVK